MGPLGRLAGPASRVTWMSCFCELRMTVLTVSPTLCSWTFATSASDESIGLEGVTLRALHAVSNRAT
jgi:hypothetical protein